MRDEAFGGGCQPGQVKNDFTSMPLRDTGLFGVGETKVTKGGICSLGRSVNVV